MAKSKKVKLTEGKVNEIIIKLTLPMVFGMLGMVIFNLVDTYYVGKLGTQELAALTFTFPMILVINSFILGIGIGTSSVISRAIGEGNTYKVKRLGTDSLLLALLTAAVLIIIGSLTIAPLFTLLGATPNLLEYIRAYMQIWYFGTLFVVVPMVGNNIIRALGDTKTPGIVMMISAFLNLMLDPIFIFGFGPIPKMGIAGAAIATVMARALTFTVALYVLTVREKVVLFKRFKIIEMLHSWRDILYIGLPNALTKMIVPVATGVLTGIIATYGIKSVAGYGVATRLEFFTLALINALASIMGPYVGQNTGARRYDRVLEGITFSEKFSMGYAVVIYIVLAIFAEPVASIFNSDSEVIRHTAMYLRIVPIAYGFQGIFLIASASYNALNRPLHASMLTGVQIGLLLPLAFVGSSLFGVKGIFFAVSIAYILAGVFSHFFIKRSVHALI